MLLWQVTVSNQAAVLNGQGGGAADLERSRKLQRGHKFDSHCLFIVNKLNFWKSFFCPFMVYLIVKVTGNRMTEREGGCWYADLDHCGEDTASVHVAHAPSTELLGCPNNCEFKQVILTLAAQFIDVESTSWLVISNHINGSYCLTLKPYKLFPSVCTVKPDKVTFGLTYLVILR